MHINELSCFNQNMFDRCRVSSIAMLVKVKADKQFTKANRKNVLSGQI